MRSPVIKSICSIHESWESVCIYLLSESRQMGFILIVALSRRVEHLIFPEEHRGEGFCRSTKNQISYPLK